MARTSEVDKLIERYEDKAEHAWEEWQLGGSMRHEGLYNRYERVVKTLERGRSAGLLASRHADLEQDVLNAKTMDDLQGIKNRIVMGDYS
jgi:hypothetical protein